MYVDRLIPAAATSVPMFTDRGSAFVFILAPGKFLESRV